MTAAQAEPPEHIAIERQMRQQVRQTMIGMGVPGDKASEITDLAFHGCDRAMTALLDAINVTPDSIVKVNATLIAGSLIEIRLQQAREAAPAVAKSMGASMMGGTVNLGGQPS